MFEPWENLKKGDWVCLAETVSRSSIARIPPNPFHETVAEYRVEENVKTVIQTPWLATTPFQIVSIYPPLITLRNLYNDELPPIIWSRLDMSRFIKVPKSYAKEYCKYFEENREDGAAYPLDTEGEIISQEVEAELTDQEKIENVILALFNKKKK
jgi:hypothetical protein